ncbi:MAG: hypothetical protein N0E48_25010 [Candidatus Thiodiazotropha endolucinida]|nr:hypothetical protein [Candidatus Thiodiazotropha endolucinida]
MGNFDKFSPSKGKLKWYQIEELSFENEHAQTNQHVKSSDTDSGLYWRGSKGAIIGKQLFFNCGDRLKTILGRFSSSGLHLVISSPD